MRKILLCVFLMSASMPMWGQADTGVITGIVTDQAGAVIPAAKVTITSQSTGVTSAITSDSQGYFTSAPINPGTYSVMATASGFQSQTQAGIILRVQDRLNLSFRMAVGQTSQSVMVTNQTPVIDSQTSSLGTVVSSSTITEMPLNGRNYLQLAGLSTGVIQTSFGSNSQTNGNTGGSSGQPGQVTFASDGARGTLNNFLLDGMDNNSNDNGGNIIYTNSDAIQEFKIQTNSYSAEFGRSGGAVINAVTKSGTNSYHGDVFEFFRNSALDARNFFQTTGSKANFKQNQWGATIGAPIIKNKLFWFGDYQGTKINNPTPLISTVPTALERTGDFSEIASSTTIYDPSTYNPVTNTRTAFLQNKIPHGDIDTLAQSLVNLYPLPNLPGFVNNYEITPAEPYLFNQGDFRGDYAPSTTDQGFFRYSMGGLTRLVAPRLPGLANGQRGGYYYTDTMGAVIGETHIFSPRTINEFRAGFNWEHVQTGIRPGGNTPPPPDLTVPGVTLYPNVTGIVQFSPSGYRGIGDPGYAPTFLVSEEREITDALTMVRGKHSIVAGGSIRWSQFNIFQVPAPNGVFDFSGQFTQNPVDGSGGNGLADALLGLPLVSTIDTLVQVQNRQFVPSAFVQDDYRASRTLTFNLGLRYDYFSPIVQKHNNQANFDYQTGKLIVAGQDGNSRGLIKVDHLNFSPRVGFAKTIHTSTVVSAGFGIFYSGQEIRTAAPLQLPYNLPFYYQPTFTSDGITPILTVSGGFPPLNPNQQTDPGVTSVDARLKTPNYIQYNLSIQQALPRRMSLELSYAGSKGTHLQSLLDNNQDKTPGPGSVQDRRPYPTYGPFAAISNRGNSKYYAFQAKLQNHATHNLYFLSSFTWSKAYDDQPEICCSSPWPQNTWNIPAEEGLADFNQTLRWVLSYDYLLPFGKGQRLLNDNRALTAIIGGWHFGGIYVLASGFPFSPQMGYDTSNTGSQGLLRGDQILPNGNLPRTDRSVNEWFNTNAYAIPATYTFGDAGRNTLIGPDSNEWDLSLRKVFAIRQSQNLEFRAEFFNALNHPQFAQPDNFITDGPGAFGVVTSTGADNRQIQLALKYSF